MALVGNSNSTAVPTLTGAQQCWCNGQIGARNPNFNRGFLQRVTAFQNASVYKYYPPGVMVPSGNSNPNGTHIWWYIWKLPLNLIHDMYMQMNFPQINIGFNKTFYLSQGQGNAPMIVYPPLQIGQNSTIITGGADTTTQPSIYYGVTASGGTGCRLYYRTVKFSPTDTAKIAGRLVKGYTLSTRFIVTDWIIPSNYIISTGNAPTQQQVTTSTVHPMRMWVLAYPNNSNISSGSNIVGQGSFIRSFSYSAGVLPGFFNQTNVNLNNYQYFVQNFQNPMDLWNQLKEQFPPEGCMLTYTDWLNFQRYMCYDLTRVAQRLRAPTEAVSLQWVGQRSDGLNYNLELYFLVERMEQITQRVAAGETASVVGNLD